MSTLRKTVVLYSLENKSTKTWKEVCEFFNLEGTDKNIKMVNDWFRYYKNTGNYEPVTYTQEEDAVTVKEVIKDNTIPDGFKIKSIWNAPNGDLRYSYERDENSEKRDYDWSTIKPLPFKPTNTDTKKQSCMQIIFPTDAHISRMELSGRTMQEKCQQVLDKIVEAVEIAQKLYSIDTLVFITGSDMFNSTGKTSHTVRGTLQEDNSSYDKAFDAIVNLNISIINYLYENCKELHVVSILGNHDEVECYMLGKYLQAYYRNLPISFDVDKKYRKYFSFGNTGIQIHHGNVPKFDYLVSSFASERPDVFCKKYTELIVGDKHHQKVTQIGKTIVRQFPSLAENDTWSEEMGFISSQGLVSEVYDYEKGHILSIDLKS